MSTPLTINGNYTSMDDLKHDGDIIINGNVTGMGDIKSKNGSVIIAGNVTGMGNIKAEGDITIGSNVTGMGNIKSENGNIVIRGNHLGQGTLKAENGTVTVNGQTQSRSSQQQNSGNTISGKNIVSGSTINAGGSFRVGDDHRTGRGNEDIVMGHKGGNAQHSGNGDIVGGNVHIGKGGNVQRPGNNVIGETWNVEGDFRLGDNNDTPQNVHTSHYGTGKTILGDKVVGGGGGSGGTIIGSTINGQSGIDIQTTQAVSHTGNGRVWTTGATAGNLTTIKSDTEKLVVFGADIQPDGIIKGGTVLLNNHQLAEKGATVDLNNIQGSPLVEKITGRGR